MQIRAKAISSSSSSSKFLFRIKRKYNYTTTITALLCNLVRDFSSPPPKYRFFDYFEYSNTSRFIIKPFKTAVYITRVYIYIQQQEGLLKNVKIEFAFPSTSIISPPSFLPLPFTYYPLSLSVLPFPFVLSFSFPLYNSPPASSTFFSLGFHYLIKFSVSVSDSPLERLVQAYVTTWP